MQTRNGDDMTDSAELQGSIRFVVQLVIHAQQQRLSKSSHIRRETPFQSLTNAQAQIRGQIPQLRFRCLRNLRTSPPVAQERGSLPRMISRIPHTAGAV